MTWMHLHVWTKPNAASFKNKLLWDGTARNNKLGKWFLTCEFSQIQWKLRGVYKILWLSIARNKLNARLPWLSLCICCSVFPALTSRMELALCTRGISQTMKGWTTLICACCLGIHLVLKKFQSSLTAHSCKSNVSAGMLHVHEFET